MFIDPADDAALPGGRFSAPDYSLPKKALPHEIGRRIAEKLIRLYGEEQGRAAFQEVARLVEVFYAHLPLSERQVLAESTRGRFSERDVVLITYADLIREQGRMPLESLARFAGDFLEDAFSCLHILPFFPYSSDRGFSVIDFKRVDARAGSWAHITRLRTRFHLMIDLVANHVSAKHAWFLEFLNARPEYRRFFISFAAGEGPRDADRRLVFRPRTSPLFTRFDTLSGPRDVWTTFSSDQIDLNYRHWPVLAAMIEVLLFYVLHGADLIRLDAVAFLWKSPGTRCLHLPETHLLVKLFRDVLDAVNPRAALITETNVPHGENITYFGKGGDEAQMVYNFSLPPLVLHAFLSGSCRRLAAWVRTLPPAPDGDVFFNFLDSHDGIGLAGARGLLEPEEIDLMIRAVRKKGGLVSYKDNGDGTTSAYELNITLYSALEEACEPQDTAIRRYLAARAVALVLAGVPGIYLHGLLGSGNDRRAAEIDKTPRSINRGLLDTDELYGKLRDPSSRTSRVFAKLSAMIAARRREPAFQPSAGQYILETDERVFGLLRKPPTPSPPLICLISVSRHPVRITLDLRSQAAALGIFRAETFYDVLSGAAYTAEEERLAVSMPPYTVLWLKPRPDR